MRAVYFLIFKWLGKSDYVRTILTDKAKPNMKNDKNPKKRRIFLEFIKWILIAVIGCYGNRYYQKRWIYVSWLHNQGEFTAYCNTFILMELARS